jgi:hypothetical protein
LLLDGSIEILNISKEKTDLLEERKTFFHYVHPVLWFLDPPKNHPVHTCGLYPVSEPKLLIQAQLVNCQI